MGRGKLSSEGQAKRRRRIIDYIRENGPVKGSEICKDLEMSRSSLSDDIHSINIGGEIISSPKRGVYVINSRAQETKNSLGRIDRQSVRRWMILLALYKKDLAFGEIMQYLAAAGIPCSQSVLYEDLKALVDTRDIVRVTKGKHRLYHSESLYETDMREIRQYEAKKAGSSARVGISRFEGIDLKIKHSFPDYEQDLKGDGIRRSGKHNVLTEEQIGLLQEFEKYPYAEKELRITFRTNAGQIVSRDVCTGIIVYVVGTARIYLIGESVRHRSGTGDDVRKYYVTIPLDRILSIAEGDMVNTCFNTPEYHRIYREMFQISAEEPMDVRVRFENYPFIRDKIERLCAIRETAHFKIAGDEIIYTDTVRGKGDFSRYLRRFGRSAIVEEPEELRENMISASRKILKLYP